MAKKNRSDLKLYFESGKRPKQSEFEDLIDSKLNLIEDKAITSEIEVGTNDEKYVTPLGARNSVLKHAPVKKVNNTFPDIDGNVVINDISGTAGTITGVIAKNQVTGLENDLNSKQALLESGISIKTINGTSILGNGDITISGSGGSSLPKLIGVLSQNYQFIFPATPPILAFPTGCDEFTLSANKTYFFRGKYLISTVAVSHTTAIGWQAMGLNITSMEYIAKLFSSAVNAAVTTASNVQISGPSSKVLNTASNSVTTTIEFEGVLRCTTGGVIKPTIAFNPALSSNVSNVMKVGSFIEFTEIGDNTIIAIGSVS